MTKTGGGADRPQQNVYVINSVEEEPEVLDPYILYNILYNRVPGGVGLYFTDGTDLFLITSSVV